MVLLVALWLVVLGSVVPDVEEELEHTPSTITASTTRPTSITAEARRALDTRRSSGERGRSMGRAPYPVGVSVIVAVAQCNVKGGDGGAGCVSVSVRGPRALAAVPTAVTAGRR